MVLNPNAVSIRPVEIKNNEPLLYKKITWDYKPHQNIQICLLRLALLSLFTSDNNNYLLDILDSNGDIIQDVEITTTQFQYLKTIFKL